MIQTRFIMEEWRNINDFPDYQVSNLGRVRSSKRLRNQYGYFGEIRTKEIKPLLDGSENYYQVSLWKDGVESKKLIHRLVAESFISNPENKPEVGHLDGNPTNNNVDNLYWCTHKENMNNPITKERLSECKIGIHPSEETRNRMSESQTKRFNGLGGN